MGMHSRREQGFTLIELLIVSIIVGILATLVAMTYSGVQAKNRNARRQTDIQQIQSKLEIYYAEHSKYPSLAELNTPDWRADNLKELKDDAISDPSWKKTTGDCTIKDDATFAVKPTGDCYAYQATTADGSECLIATVECAQYTLTATLEGGEKYVKSSLN
jgi:prepilin-type N-terminal cleavage/methylation domain-containing protein